MIVVEVGIVGSWTLALGSGSSCGSGSGRWYVEGRSTGGLSVICVGV